MQVSGRALGYVETVPNKSTEKLEQVFCLRRVTKDLCTKLGINSPAAWTSSFRTFATREGESTEEKFGNDLDVDMAPPKGAQGKQGHDFENKVSSQVLASLMH